MDQETFALPSIVSDPSVRRTTQIAIIAAMDQAIEKTNLGYGSTGTLSTDQMNSFDSTSTGRAKDNGHLRSLDLVADNDDFSEESALVGDHSRDSSSSYSDLSSDEGGYYDFYSRHIRNTKSRDGCSVVSFIDRHVITRNNFKVLVSGVLWWSCYMIMGILGGSVAYMHFERTDSPYPDPLPDFGYDVIPYWCPNIPHVPHGNVQSIVLFILYSIIIAGIVLRWSPRYTKGAISWGGDGRLILQQLFHLNCLVFLSRTTTVGLTGLPQPNPKCVNQQHLQVTFDKALSFVMGRGLVPHACGDLIYSGHVGCTLMCMSILHRHGFLKNRVAAVLVWLTAIVGIYFTISCRSHYSVDVVLAFWFGYFIPEWYFNRSDGRVRGPVSRWIRRLEVWPNDCCIHVKESDEKERDTRQHHYPCAINV